MTLMHVMSYAIPVIASCALKHLIHCTILPLSHIRSYTLNHVEPKSEIQAEQVQKEYGGPQMTSCMDTNQALDQGKPRCI
jgi:hypothetical protein